MTVLQHLDAMVVMENNYRQKAKQHAFSPDACLLCAEHCRYHREILEFNCGEYLDRDISGSQAAELSHLVLEKDRIEAILGVG